jgi:hypothetical protein
MLDSGFLPSAGPAAEMFSDPEFWHQSRCRPIDGGPLACSRQGKLQPDLLFVLASKGVSGRDGISRGTYFRRLVSFETGAAHLPQWLKSGRVSPAHFFWRKSSALITQRNVICHIVSRRLAARRAPYPHVPWRPQGWIGNGRRRELHFHARVRSPGDTRRIA